MNQATSRNLYSIVGTTTTRCVVHSAGVKMGIQSHSAIAKVCMAGTNIRDFPKLYFFSDFRAGSTMFYLLNLARKVAV